MKSEFLAGEIPVCSSSPVSSPSLHCCLLWTGNVGGHRPGADNQTISQEKSVYLPSLLGFPTAQDMSRESPRMIFMFFAPENPQFYFLTSNLQGFSLFSLHQVSSFSLLADGV